MDDTKNNMLDDIKAFLQGIVRQGLAAKEMLDKWEDISSPQRSSFVDEMEHTFFTTPLKSKEEKCIDTPPQEDETKKKRKTAFILSSDSESNSSELASRKKLEFKSLKPHATIRKVGRKNPTTFAGCRDKYRSLQSMMIYAGNHSLPKCESLIEIGGHILDRGGFATMSPTKFIRSDVIDTAVSILSKVTKEAGVTSRRGYLPCSYSYEILRHKFEREKFYRHYIHRGRYISESVDYDKVVSTFELMAGFFVGVDEWSFEDWPIVRPKEAKRQTNGYDCGVHVIHNMHSNLEIPQWDNDAILSDEKSSPGAGRRHLASILLGHRLNNIREFVQEKAIKYVNSHNILVV